MKVATADRLTLKSLSEAVRDRLLRLIAKGELQPGDRLNEVHLADGFGISRGPIREAARELEGQGFLVSRPNQGFYVANFTPREIRDIYEAKDWLEAAFISDIAAHVEIATRRAILADIDCIDRTDRVTFTETLFQFRLRMSTHIPNRFLADLMIALYRKFYIVSAIVKVPGGEERQARIVNVLRRFWTAMVEADVEVARAIMADDTAYWLSDLPPRFAVDAEVPQQSNPRKGSA
jgi:DNA-binding GntR family transcriptional regulator